MNTEESERQVAIVTGAGSGIGRSVTLALLTMGFDVALAGRDRVSLESVARESDHGNPLVVPTDVTDEQQVINLFAETGAAFGRVDLLFNNAGASGSSLPIDELGYDDWISVVDLNLNGAFLCAREAFRTMRRQVPQGGRIINNGSVSAQSPRPNSVAYTASKHALTGVTKALALEGRHCNIACGQIDIGNAATTMSSGHVSGTLQADNTVKPEPIIELEHVVSTVLAMVKLPLHANIPFVTVMATDMPLVGRG